MGNMELELNAELPVRSPAYASKHAKQECLTDHNFRNVGSSPPHENVTTQRDRLLRLVLELLQRSGTAGGHDARNEMRRRYQSLKAEVVEWMPDYRVLQKVGIDTSTWPLRCLAF